MKPVLVGLPYSPWTEKARWALDHHGVSYRFVEHLPMLGEPVLRALVRDFSRPLTVPLLITRDQVARDSFAIGLYAESVGNGGRLFPDRQGQIADKNELAERIMQVGRARATARLLADPEALRELVPSALSPLSSLLLPSARLATAFVRNKHVKREVPSAESQAELDGLLASLAKALGDRSYVLGDDFTFADIALACSLGFIAPHPRTPLGEAGRRAFSEPELARAYPRLIAWRDRLVELHR